jgi:hypothetical protein
VNDVRLANQTVWCPRCTGDERWLEQEANLLVGEEDSWVCTTRRLDVGVRQVMNRIIV